MNENLETMLCLVHCKQGNLQIEAILVSNLKADGGDQLVADQLNQVMKKKMNQVLGETVIDRTSVTDGVLEFNNAIQCPLKITFFKSNGETTIARNSSPGATIDA